MSTNMMTKEELERVEQVAGDIRMVRKLLDHIRYLQQLCSYALDRINAQSELLTKMAEKKMMVSEEEDLINFLKAEIERLKNGQFTEEELQNLCHNLTPRNECAFKLGCEKYQRELFGKGAIEEEMERCIKWVEWSADIRDNEKQFIIQMIRSGHSPTEEK